MPWRLVALVDAVAQRADGTGGAAAEVVHAGHLARGDAGDLRDDGVVDRRGAVRRVRVQAVGASRRPAVVLRVAAVLAAGVVFDMEVVPVLLRSRWCRGDPDTWIEGVRQGSSRRPTDLQPLSEADSGARLRIGAACFRRGGRRGRAPRWSAPTTRSSSRGARRRPPRVRDPAPAVRADAAALRRPPHPERRGHRRRAAGHGPDRLAPPRVDQRAAKVRAWLIQIATREALRTVRPDRRTRS